MQDAHSEKVKLYPFRVMLDGRFPAGGGPLDPRAAEAERERPLHQKSFFGLVRTSATRDAFQLKLSEKERG